METDEIREIAIKDLYFDYKNPRLVEYDITAKSTENNYFPGYASRNI